MPLSEIGVYWLWFLLIADLSLWAADRDFRRNLRYFGINLWELFRTLWGMVSYQKEAEPVDQDFKGLLSRLLRSGFKDAFAYVGPKYSKRRIEFRKYFRGIDRYGIELRFPNEGWGSEYFGALRSYCEADGLTYRIDSRGIGDTPNSLRVEFGHDIDAAANLTRGIWTEVFSLKEDAPRRMDERGISAFNELVDRADQKRMSIEEGFRHVHPDRPYTSPGEGCLLGAWRLASWVAFYGLIISALSSAGSPAEWSLAFDSVSFGGSTDSLVFMLLFLFAVAINRQLRERFKKQHEKLRRLPNPKWLDGLYRVNNWVVTITLPIAVVFVWAFV